MGGEAVANGDSVGGWEGAQRLVNTAIETFGDLHVVVNNAGILRDRVLANMTEEEWDAVINVHLKGTFARVPLGGRLLARAGQGGRAGRAAGSSTRRRCRASTATRGRPTTAPPRPGIAAFTTIAASEVARYGVTVNAVAPVALTRMTEGLGPAPETDEEREMRSPRWIAPIVTWLASEEAAGVTGRVFEASGDSLAVAEGWRRGPSVAPLDDPTQLGPVVADLVAKARKNSGLDGRPGTWPQPQ